MKLEPIFEIKGLKKSFKDFSLKGLDISLNRGYIMGFIGPNGAGKTTTIKLMMNLMKKDEGEIKVFGKNYIQFEIEIKNKIGFVYDENHFYEELTIEEMKWVIAPFYREWDEALFRTYLKDFNLPPKKKIKDLSRGMKMKFSLAIALSHNAELFIMDEPTSGLDPVVRSELLEILSQTIQDEKKAVFFSTHITSDLDKIADYIVMIDNGEIVLAEEKDELLERYGLVRGKREILNNANRSDFINAKENQFGFEALVKNKDCIRKTYGDKIIIEKPNIEDIMLYYTGRWQNAKSDN